ncbi:undecaprenyl-diphosphatase [Thioploca ingrica]|uniref:Undecaprenyl-diphosphatase n=1 Tax=Thioploca ingrica TaxID=40754 RepID=A0A090AHS2_9GAMM|nr:undecaprenyl-diphosphatase [Thioploca ingrica]
MDILHIVVLAVIQGLTEFLPISSSAHLILIPRLLGWEDQGIAFDVSLHIGSLIAVLIYFKPQLSYLLSNWLSSFKDKKINSESRLVWGIGIATIPVSLVGLAITNTGVDVLLRSPLIIASTTIIFGLLLGLAEWIGTRERNEYSLTWQQIILIGLVQALALIPGTSRSGVTMTAALLLGLTRKAAARFSFLLSIPAIILAGADETLSLVMQANHSVAWSDLLLGATVSAFSAYWCIRLFINLLDRIGMFPFVFYRLGLGIALFILVV